MKVLKLYKSENESDKLISFELIKHNDKLSKLFLIILNNYKIIYERYWMSKLNLKYNKLAKRFDCDYDVNLNYSNLILLPLKFGTVKGCFDCAINKLTSLEYCPKEVGGNFYCYDNHLTLLKGSPKEIGGGFYCYYNKLTSLEGSPNKVGGSFNCSDNQLTSLEGCPNKVVGDFYCSYNQLTSLEGCPNIVGEYFSCSNNQLTSLEHCPNKVGGLFNCSDNQLTSLKFAPVKFKDIIYENCGLPDSIMEMYKELVKSGK